jgi:hypothetical protein
MQKWVAKSVVSALKLDTMDDSDKDDIINALENGGDSDEINNDEENLDIDFMDDDYRGGEPDLESGEEILLDDDEGPGGYLGDEPIYHDSDPSLDNQGGENWSYMDDDEHDYDPDLTGNGGPNWSLPKNSEGMDIDGPISYMTDDDMEPCGKDVDCGEGMEEGMSKWNEPDGDDGGMGWETNENVSYMGDDYTEEEIDRLFDNTNNSDDIYGMNEPKPTTAPPTTVPDTPTRPSKTPFTPPIRPGEEDRPKARYRGRNTDYMDDGVEFS